MVSRVPVRIDGIEYPSMSAAARALGVSVSAIYGAVEAGTIEGYRPGRTRPKPVTIDGTTYPSIAAAVAATGMPRGRISKVLARERAAAGEVDMDLPEIMRRRWRHRRRGTVYRVIGEAIVQADAPLADMSRVVIYEGEAGDLWARPLGEFKDGRFAPEPEPGGGE